MFECDWNRGVARAQKIPDEEEGIFRPKGGVHYCMSEHGLHACGSRAEMPTAHIVFGEARTRLFNTV